MTGKSPPRRRKGCTINVSPEVYQELVVRKASATAHLRRNQTFDDVLWELLKLDDAKPQKSRKNGSKAA